MYLDDYFYISKHGAINAFETVESRSFALLLRKVSMLVSLCPRSRLLNGIACHNSMTNRLSRLDDLQNAMYDFLHHAFHLASSFVPSEEEGVQNKQPSFDTNSMMEELSSLESRMTVVETAVAEVIEWIRTRGETGIFLLLNISYMLEAIFNRR